MPKASDAEIECRIESIVDLILQGKTRSYILRYFANLSPRTVEYDMQKAWQRIKEANDGSREEKVSRHLKRYDAIAIMAVENKNLFAALRAYELQAKIMGLELAPAEPGKIIGETEIETDALVDSLSSEAVH